MAGGQFRLSMFIELPVATIQIAITAYDLLVFRIPHDELFVAVLTGIELIKVEFLTRTSASLTEGNLSQTTNLSHGIWCLLSCYYIYLVMTFVGQSEMSFRCQFLLYQFLIDWWNDRLLLWCSVCHFL